MDLPDFDALGVMGFNYSLSGNEWYVRLCAYGLYEEVVVQVEISAVAIRTSPATGIPISSPATNKSVSFGEIKSLFRD